ncbi:DM13 domain-containing protein [Cryptosporangium arvum]|uniref:Electron transfer DM13 n=1 Tax=Cryptosporangium arvum DSM 44712 TaxID=927661 RepID=A0A010YZ70_9ACTN|nr:DM13 domain-containing protein [Cryptosporangium arvum]EXG80523.1 Electron transfer DM13 [Cryptosporangium arvum DSM 44712]
MFPRLLTWVLVPVLVAGAGFGLYWFQPWRLATDTTVADEVPVVATPTTSPSAGASPVGNRLVATGSFVTHEHETSGRVQLIERPDGRHQLVLIGLRTSDGPDLRVWLTDQAVRPGRPGWHVFDDGRYLEVAALRGNRGDQVYDLPVAAELDGLRSVTVWCKRFSVSFGAAELTLA